MPKNKLDNQENKEGASIMAGLTMNYDFTFRPRVRPNRSWDAQVLNGGKRPQPPKDAPRSRAIINDNHERALSLADDKMREFGNIMHANRNDKDTIIENVHRVLQPPKKWRREEPKPEKYYMCKKRLDPVTAQRLLDKGAKKYPTATRNVFMIIGDNSMIYGMVAFPTKKSRKSNRHQH